MIFWRGPVILSNSEVFRSENEWLLQLFWNSSSYSPPPSTFRIRPSGLFCRQN
jgi:hypothetical protein